MKKFTVLIVLFAALLILTACGQDRPSARVIVQTSATSMPGWILAPKKDFKLVYFSGISTAAPDIRTARERAVDDAISQLVEYIGFRATHTVESTTEYFENDEVSTFVEEIKQSLEGTGNATVSVDVVEVYFEKYSDNTYDMYALIQFPKDWVERERERIAKLIKEQRETTIVYLENAKTSVDKDNLAKALDEALNAFFVSGQAAENGDLYDESKNVIVSILNSLSFSVYNEPKFAYLEGGSQTIRVQVVSSITGKPLKGIMMDSYEKNSNAVTVSRSGYSTGDNGLIDYEVSRLLEPDAGSLDVIISFGLNKMEVIAVLDPDFYETILQIQDSLSLPVELELVSYHKASPTVVVMLSVIQDRASNRFNKPVLTLDLQEKVSGIMANLGFNIISAQIPNSVLIQSDDSDTIKDSIIGYIKGNYPDVDRALYGFELVNLMGTTVLTSRSETYNTGLESVEINFEMSLINFETGKVEKSFSIISRGAGLNVDQGVKMAENRILEKLKIELSNI